MRFGIIPSTLRERLALLAGMVPVPVVDCLVPLVQTRALMAAVRLGIFEAIGSETRNVADIARSCKVDVGTLDMVLRLMRSTGYIEQSGVGQYRLSSLARRTMLPGARMELRHYVEWNYLQWRLLEHMEELLETGKGLDIHHSITDPQAWTTYQYAMLELARTAAPIVARLVPVPSGAKCLLDLGGGHGLFGATICRRHPPLRSIVLDLPSALEPARQLARKVGIDDIVEYRAANLLEDSLGQGADVVLLSNIVHHFSPEQNADLLIRVYSAMNPGGTVAIWDSERRPPNARAEVASDAASLYFRLTSTSQVTTAKEYETWLRNAGFLQVRSRRSLRAPVNIMTIGKR